MFKPVEHYTTITCAGGGNRCWWQAGLLDAWAQQGRLQARRFVGTSAGAGVAAAVLCDTLQEAIAGCRAAYRDNLSMWRGQRGAWFAHDTIYPAWVRSFMSESGLTRFKDSGAELHVGVARLPRALPNWTGLGLGMLAYMIEKYGTKQLHPRFAQWCGLRMELHPLHTAATLERAIHLLISGAAASPFVASRQLGGQLAVDGGFADNAPRLPLTGTDDAHLVLLTRHYPKRPTLFQFEGRTYLQPSVRIPVSTLGCTLHTDIMGAIALGRRDGAAALRSLSMGANAA
jgi:predicted acylesterase/phospholipase RssA